MRPRRRERLSDAIAGRILYEDRDLVVVDKPAGMLTTHTRLEGRAAREAQLTAENCLNDYLRKGQARSRLRVWLVHRLDRETSGVMMFAKSEEVAEHFRADWANLTEKTYLADVEGELVEESGEFRSFLKEDADGYRVRSVKKGTPGAKEAVTRWRQLGVGKGFTQVEATLVSGRKNQIRVHFAEAGHPVVGDVKYGAARADRLHLHSHRLAFIHPRTGKRMEFTSTPRITATNMV